MPQPLNICLEKLEPSASDDRFMCCVANVGGQSGLGVSRRGQICWQQQHELSCELWVSSDDRLILVRPVGAPKVQLSRVGRSLDVPCGKPVVLLDQDVLVIGTKRFRLHVHGPAEAVVPPTPLQPSRSGRSKLTAAAFALGVAMASTGCKDIEVRERPPAPPPPPPPPTAPLAAPVPADQAVEAKQKIETLAQKQLPDMKPEGLPLVGKFGTGQVLMKTVTLDPSKVYGAIGVGLKGVEQLDVTIVDGTPPKLSRYRLARDYNPGVEAVVGGGGNPLRVSPKEPRDATIHVHVKGGNGVVMVQLFSKQDPTYDGGQASKPDGGQEVKPDGGQGVKPDGG